MSPLNQSNRFERQLQTPLDPWDARVGFFWYSDREIFQFTPADFRRRAEEFAAAGFTPARSSECGRG